MRVHGGRWWCLPLLGMVLLAMSIPLTSTRKIFSGSDPEEKSADEGLLPFITSTLAPLTDYIFGRNEKDGNKNGLDSPKESNPHNSQDTSRTSQPELPDIDLRMNVIPKGEDSEESSWNEIAKGSDSAQRLEDDTEQTEKKKKKRQWNKSANSLLESLEMQEDTEKALIKKQNDLVNDVNDEEEKMKNVETKVEDLLKDSLQRDEKARWNKNSSDFSHFDKGRDLMVTGKEKWTGKMGDWKTGDNTSMMVMDDRRYFQPRLPVVGDLERYIRTCDNCLVQWDSFQCPLNDKAIELKKWITEWEKILSFGCQLRDGCDGTHKCCHSRDPAFETALTEMTDMARQMYNTFQSSCSGCPRHGGWGDWCEWSGCSTTCGPGTRTRSRQCNNPAPKGSGRQCEGRAMDSTPCKGPPCCMDGNWGSWQRWGSSSVTCGVGLRERRRLCNNPSPNYCGVPCPGRDMETDTYDTRVPCVTCVDGNWGSWNRWSTPSATCGVTRRERTRRCDNPPANNCGRPCPGRNIETDQYDTRVPCEQCVDREWFYWGSWTACDVTCGRGMRSRRRTCKLPRISTWDASPQVCGNRCPGRAEELENCPGLPSCEPPWGSWTPCSVTCNGFGTRERGRLHTVPGVIGGRQVEQEACQVFNIPCPPMANWGQWKGWCPCHCRLGLRSRSRDCEQPSIFGPNTAIVDMTLCGAGASREEEPCDIRDSCPSCVSDCSERTDGDYPSCTSCRDYLRCKAGFGELYACSSNNYEWDAFIRKCVAAPSPSCALATCISSCVGKFDGPYHSCFGCNAYVECRNGRVTERPCPLGLEFNAHVSQCQSRRSLTCQRQITNNINFAGDAPADNYFGEDIAEEKARKEVYLELGKKAGVADKYSEIRQKIVNGNWGWWQSWGPSTVMCGVGERKRRRFCDNPSPTYCGRPCPGPDVDTQTYDTGVDCSCLVGNWLSWDPWTIPTVTCGFTVRERTRRCNRPPSNSCQSSCPGSNIQTANYNTEVLCINCVPQNGTWGKWSQFSACDENCKKKRTRQCDDPPPNSCGEDCEGDSEEVIGCDSGDGGFCDENQGDY